MSNLVGFVRVERRFQDFVLGQHHRPLGAGNLHFTTGSALFIKEKKERTTDHYLFLQALLKTDYNEAIYKSRAYKLRGGYNKYRKQFLSHILFPNYDPKNKIHADIVKTQDEVAKIAQRLVNLTGSGRRELEHRIENLEGKIEKFAAQLYGNELKKAA